MDKKQLINVLRSNFKPVAGTNFADAAVATRNALIDYYGLKGLNSREIRANKAYIMTLIEEVIDEELPKRLNQRIEQFAEVNTYARDEEVIFKIDMKGRRRAHLTIKKGQRGGVYQAARLDKTEMSLDVWTETVGVFITLEEILLGKYTLRDLMNNILQGFEERLYVQVIEALQGATTNLPTANQATAANFVKDDFDAVLRVISAYGRPVIMGFKSTISKMTNQPGWTDATPTIPEQDLIDYRNQGFIGSYMGYPVVQLENYITDETKNDTWLLDESYIFILPADSKPVKVALKGDMYIQPNEHVTGSQQEDAHKMLGVGLLLTNNIGIYEDTAA